MKGMNYNWLYCPHCEHFDMQHEVTIEEGGWVRVACDECDCLFFTKLGCDKIDEKPTAD